MVAIAQVGVVLLGMLMLSGTFAPARAAACGPGAMGLPEQLIALLPVGNGADRKRCEKPNKRGGDRQARLKSGALQFTPTAINGPFVANEVLAIVFGDRSVVDAVATQFNLSVVSTHASQLLGGTVVRYAIQNGTPVAVMTAALARDPRTDETSPNHLFTLQAGESGTPQRFEHQKLSLPTGADVLSGSGVRIAVIDTAIDPDHPALQGAVVASFDAYPEVPVKDRDHATAVAGLIAGRGELKGVAPGSELLIARVFDRQVNERQAGGPALAGADAILEALDWSLSNQANIVNLSFTGPRNRLISRALTGLHDRGILIVAAAGNNGPRAPYAYPAADRSVLAITATDYKNRIYPRANRGSYISLAAPGVDVMALKPGGGIDFATGTSFSTALVSGMAALLMEAAPNQSPARIAQQIKMFATDLGAAGHDTTYGAGLANARATLKGLRP